MDTVTGNNHETGLEVAVIGMAGRFPGARNIEEFWNNLLNGVESISFFTDEELIEAGTDPQLLKEPNYVKAKGVLEDVESFDSTFFNYSPREAELMDPQFRILHECAWHTLEDGGYNPDTYQGAIGFFVGCLSNYQWVGGLLSRIVNKSEQIGIGVLNDRDFLSTRIAYKLNLKGPAVNVQTACSTSLTAIHLAYQGLLSGESDMAVAGGVSVWLPKKSGYLYENGMVRSPDGRCRAFDAEAMGTNGGDGVACVLLKRLDDALEDRDHIYAVLKGSAFNNDGNRKVGYTAPSVLGQQEAIRAALQMAEVPAESITYVEAHGTGTTLGDPVEIEALKRAFDVEKRQYCAVGSVKTNIGHLDSAAGAAGFIKTVLALKHRLIPPSLHLKTPNPNIDFENSPFYVNTAAKEWQRSGYPLRAGVSSFGLGGTNVHTVLEEAPAQETSGPGRNLQLLLLSAKTTSALERAAENLGGYFKENPGVNLADAAYTLKVGRKAFEHRCMLVCPDVKHAAEALSATGDKAYRTLYTKEGKKFVIFMFPGGGSQYVNMGLGLYETQPLFREEMDRCFRILEPLAGYDMKTLLYPSDTDGEKEGGDIMRIDVANILIFIIEYSLARLLIDWGIKPAAMIGHSLGEYTAACISGVFPLETALELVVTRGRLMHRIKGGTMLSVSLGKEETATLIKDKKLSMAASNSPANCVVAGPRETITTFAQELEKKNIDNRILHIPVASHSFMMEPVLDEFKEAVESIRPTIENPVVPYVSNVTGNWISGGEVAAPDYWARHLTSTVRFAEGLETLLKNDGAVLVEVGPGHALNTFARQFPQPPRGVNLIRHPREDFPDDYFLLDKIGQLWLFGVPIDWSRFYSKEERHRIPLPPYPFAKNLFPIDLVDFKPPEGAETGKDRLTRNSDITDWFYTPVWEQAVMDGHSSLESLEEFHWLVFSDESQFGDQLSQRLRHMTSNVTVVTRGDEYRKEDQGSFTINPAADDDYDKLFKEVKEWGEVPITIVHLWSVTGGTAPGSRDGKESPFELETLERTLDSGLYSMLNIARATGSLNIAGPIRVEIITDHLHDVTGEETVNPGKATMLGAIKIIPLEYPGIQCRNIDVQRPEPGSTQEEKLLHGLLTEFTFVDSPGNLIALRGSRRWTQVHKPVLLKDTVNAGITPEEKGVYLITGGFGGMGLTLAGHLASAYRARLVLLGRSALPNREDWDTWTTTHPEDDPVSQKIRQVREMEKHGAEVMTIGADISNYNRMKKAFSEIVGRFGCINGVLHTAGIADYHGVIQRRTRQMTEEVLAPKVRGTLVLDRLVSEMDVKPAFMVLFSSLGNTAWGLNFGQVGYTAANEFLDAFSTYKNASDDMFTVSINWPAWEEVGMWAKVSAHWDEKSQAIDYSSLLENAMNPREGVEAFQRILGAPHARVAVSPADLNGFIDLCHSLRKTTLQTETESWESEDGGEGHPRPELSTPFIEPANETEMSLAGIFRKNFGIRQVGVRDNFFELGGDSLKAINVSTKIHKEMDVEIPIAEFFAGPTVQELAEYIQSQQEINPYSSIELVEKKEYYVISSAQKRLYILDRRENMNTAYNMPTAMKIEGPLMADRFKEAVLTLIKRHESLRTSFEIWEGELVQKILDHDDIEFELEFHDIAGARDEAKTGELINEFIRPFDLSQAPLLRTGLIKLEEQEYIVLFDLHHIISDGISRNILEQEFIELYAGNLLPRLNISYKDFSEWEQYIFATPLFKQQEEFWGEYLKGEPDRLLMPLDSERPEEQTFEGKVITFTIPAEITEKLDIIAKVQGITMNFLVLSIYFLLLHKYSSRKDIIVGSLVSGRNHADLENVMGMFGNFLPIRCRIEPDRMYQDYLKSAAKSILSAYENQVYPFEEMVKLSNVTVDLSGNPLFDTMLIFHNEKLPSIQLEINDLKISGYPLASRTAKLDFKIDVFLGGEGEFNCLLEYNTNLFKEKTMTGFARHFQDLITGILDNPDRKVADIEIFTKEESLDLLQKRARNNIQKNQRVRLVVSATFTSEPVNEYITWWGKQFGLDTEVAFASYNQVFQELLNEESLLSTNGEGGVNVLLIRFEDWIRDLNVSEEKKIQTLEKNFKNLVKIVKDKPKKVPYLAGIFPPAPHLSFSPNLMNKLEDMYLRWSQFLETIANTHVVDFTRLMESYSISESFDPVTDREGHLPFSSEFYAAVGTTIARKVCAAVASPFKVIVLDCDNTLWKGICGEDGPLGVGVDAPYLELQQFMLSKYNQGFLLALCSKNNEADAWEVFEKNPGMLLKKEHFVDWKINWNPKSENIKALAQKLNLGMDSFIFIDDSPMECSEVMMNCPETLTLQLPENPESIPLYLQHVWAFDKIRITGEDRLRTQMYQAEKKRKATEEESHSLEEFLAELGLRISLNLMEPSQLSRVSQLTQRTNQFNLSTIRRNEDEIINLVKEPDVQCWVMEVSDRFGDYGLVGVVITRNKKESLFIDTLLLSCRVLGRGVEEAMLAGLKLYCRQQDLKALEADYYPTPKNKPVLNFMEKTWNKEKEEDKCTSFKLPIKNIPAPAEFIDFYYLKNLEKGKKPEAVEAPAIDAVFDHVAVAVSDIGAAVSFYQQAGYDCGDMVHDPLQRSNLVMCCKPGYDSIELVAAADSDSPTHRITQKNGNTPYHLCYQVASIEELLKLFRQKEIEFEIVSDLKPAILFDNQKVMFIQVKHVGLVEFLEDKACEDTGSNGGGEHQKNSTVRIVVSRPEPSLEFYKLLGYTPVKNINTPEKLEITLAKTGAGKIELVVPKEANLQEYAFLNKNGPQPYQLCLYDNDAFVEDTDQSYICYRKKTDQVSSAGIFWTAPGEYEHADQLLHKNHLLPLENYTAEMLLGLPTYSIDDKIIQKVKYEPPRNKLESELVEIWSEILGVEQKAVSIDANFFQLGGHSLKATILISKIHKRLNADISLAKIFKIPTIRRLSGYIKGLSKEQFVSIQPVEKKEYYPLSSAQKRLYILHQMEPENTTYNMPQVIPLTETTDIKRLKEVFMQLIKRHESLRTSFIMQNEEPVQRVHDNLEFEIEYLEPDTGDQDKNIVEHFVRPYDLSRAPLLRAGVLEIPGKRRLLLADMHHIISDGTSHQVLGREIAALYDGESLPPLRIQYKDFAEWMAHEAQREVTARQEAFWLETFKGEIPRLDLPFDYPRPAVQSFEGDTMDVEISSEKTRALKTAVLESGVTLYMLLSAAFYVLLSKLAGLEDIIVGTPVAGRRHSDQLDVIGMFVKTLALRHFPGSEMLIPEFLSQVKERTLEAFENQEYPFEDLVEKLDLNRDAGRNPLFDVMFVLQNIFDDEGSERSGSEIIDEGADDVIPHNYRYEDRVAKFDLTLSAMELKGGLQLKFQYCTRLFEKETIRRFGGYYKEILHALLEAPGITLGQIEFMPEEEKRLILEDFNRTAMEFPAGKTIHQLFEEQVEKTGDGVAAISLFTGSETGTAGEKDSGRHPMYHAVTYKELNNQSNRLALRLLEMGAGPGTIAAVMVEHPLELIISLFGILKTGAAYLPISPQYPGQRKQFMLDDSRAKFLVVDDVAAVPEADTKNYRQVISNSRLPMDGPASPEGRRPADNLHPPDAALPTPENTTPAYTIYTSGTTGRPKGVVVEHRCVVNTLLYRKQMYELNPGSVSIQLFSSAFDGFVTSFFTPIVSGAKIVLPGKEEMADIEKLTDALVKNNVTHFICIPPLYRLIIGNLTGTELAALKVVTLAGDRIDADLLETTRRKNPHLEIVNEYGVTEASVMSTIYRHQERDSRIKIGHPTGNTGIYILNRQLRLQPIGVWGELCISGAGLARGYLNRPELTEERFIQPDTGHSQSLPPRLYRTGDMACWMPDGNVRLLGRMDHQVKVRGFRIELGEIETQLSKLEAIKDAVVLVKDNQLAAYLVSTKEYKVAQLRELLSAELPEYMLPSSFIQVEKIPLTPNGKLDKKALEKCSTRIGTGVEFVPPKNDTEKQIVEIWKEVLGLEKVGTHDNFFELGGNSLDILKVSGKLKDILKRDIPVVSLFRYTTIKALVRSLQKEGVDEFHSIDRTGALNKGRASKMSMLKARRGDLK